MSLLQSCVDIPNISTAAVGVREQARSREPTTGEGNVRHRRYSEASWGLPDRFWGCEMGKGSSARWSRPATGRQIAALKAHGNYDGKYYSMGRASQAIGRSSSGGSPRQAGSGSNSYPTRFSPSYSSSSFLSQLLGVPDDLQSILSAALEQHSASADATGEDAVRAVTFTVAPDESDPRTPRIVFEAEVIRSRDYTGDPEVSVRFVSNVTFGDEAPVSRSPSFQSGVRFDE